MERQTATKNKPKRINSSSLSRGILQRKCACGNQSAGGGECGECGKKKQFLQRRATHISEPGDRYEQEADRIADQVMRMPEPTAKHQVGSEKEGVLQRKAIANSITLLQGRSTDQNQSSEVPPIVSQVINSPGQSLDTDTRAFMEPRFGQDFSQVRVYTDAKAAKSAQEVNAQAYTMKHNIVFGAGQYRPRTAPGKRLLAHELTHVVQQLGTDRTCSGQGNENLGAYPISPHTLVRQSKSLQINHYLGSPSAVIFRSESVHPEEQHCEDVSKDSTATCDPIIACIEELIEQLAGRFSDFENKGGDEGHRTRIKIVQTILKTLMAMALSTCKKGEYDEELAEEAEKWANKPVQKVVFNDEPSLREKIAKALEKAGIPSWAVAALVVLIIAALADPEPFSKVAAILGAALATAVFLVIGRLGNAPANDTNTASSPSPSSSPPAPKPKVPRSIPPTAPALKVPPSAPTTSPPPPDPSLIS